jgi:hypothetical protein
MSSGFRISSPPKFITLSTTGNPILNPSGWQVQNNNTNINFRKSAYGQGKWIVIASSGVTSNAQYVTSTDGSNWFDGSSNAFFDTGVYAQYVDIIYANNRWVTVSRQGYPNRAASSPDGITWTRRDTSGGATSALSATSFNCVVYDSSQFVIAGGNSRPSDASRNKIFTSPDGDTWTGRRIVLQDSSDIDVTASLNEWTSVAYDNSNNLWVAVSSTAGIKNVLNSKDNGVTWYSPTDLSGGMNTRNWQRVVFGNNTFVAVASNVGVSDCIATSKDGVKWDLRNAPTSTGAFYSVGFGNGIFIAVSQAGNTNQRTIVSSDGINWYTLYNPVDNDFYGVTYGNGYWILNSNTGTNNRILKLDYIKPTTIFTLPIKTHQIS